MFNFSGDFANYNPNNILLAGDSYKYSHPKQLPPGTKYISSYIESRGGIFDKTVFFGFQMFVKRYLMTPLTYKDLEEAKSIVGPHGLPFDEDLIKIIIEEFGGYMPVMIQAVPEGTVVDTKNVLVQSTNTDERFAWLPQFLEACILRAVWFPTTVASLSWNIKQIIKNNLKRTSDHPETIDFKLHDFGDRGVSSFESAGIGGAAHIVNFLGTDTLPAILYAKMFYNAQGPVAFSIPAMEHSTVTSWGRENEIKAYENMMDAYAKPGAIYAVVSDSYDIWNTVSHIFGEQLKERIISSGATLVVRPDSGEPVKVVLEVITRLMDKFGFTVNSKGYKVLPDYIRVIQGDGINLNSIEDILDTLEDNKISGDNIAFGMGGALLQGVNRDSLKFAQKASYAIINDVGVDVYKDPITDKGKTSKKGILALVKSVQGKNCYTTIREEVFNNQLEKENILKLVYLMGSRQKNKTKRPYMLEYEWEDIRQRANAALS